MPKIQLPEPLHGDSLLTRLKEKIIHQPIADNFLYKNASLMISSQPSVGKSVIAIQAALQLANGLPLFGALYVPKPMRVWYIQMERPDIECLERIQYMTADSQLAESEFTRTNLYIDVELQALNFLNDNHLLSIIERGRKISPDIIIIDPLYGIAPGLSKDEVGSNVAKVFTILKKEFGCCLWINHHTTKFTYEIVNGERVEKDDPFYGAQWLKAHVTASYIAVKTNDGTKLVNKKNSHQNVLEEVKLAFDEDTYLSTMDTRALDYFSQYKMWINAMYRNQTYEYNINDAMRHLGCTIGTLRNIHCTPSFRDSVGTTKTPGFKTIYRINKPI